MLEYFKTILDKVSFNQELFEKELRKAIRSLIPHEVEELKKWCYENFSSEHKPVLASCFAN